jgi:hypothetical protein
MKLKSAFIRCCFNSLPHPFRPVRIVTMIRSVERRYFRAFAATNPMTPGKSQESQSGVCAENWAAN